MDLGELSSNRTPIGCHLGKLKVGRGTWRGVSGQSVPPQEDGQGWPLGSQVTLSSDMTSIVRDVGKEPGEQRNNSTDTRCSWAVRSWTLPFTFLGLSFPVLQYEEIG